LEQSWEKRLQQISRAESEVSNLITCVIYAGKLKRRKEIKIKSSGENRSKIK